MKRIDIENEFTQWAEYLARYFGHDLLIYTAEGSLMWGSPAIVQRNIAELKADPYVMVVNKDIGQSIAYLDSRYLTDGETNLLYAIIPFIESQLDDEEA